MIQIWRYNRTDWMPIQNICAVLVRTFWCTFPSWKVQGTHIQPKLQETGEKKQYIQLMRCAHEFGRKKIKKTYKGTRWAIVVVDNVRLQLLPYWKTPKWWPPSRTLEFSPYAESKNEIASLPTRNFYIGLGFVLWISDNLKWFSINLMGNRVIHAIWLVYNYEEKKTQKWHLRRKTVA